MTGASLDLDVRRRLANGDDADAISAAVGRPLSDFVPISHSVADAPCPPRPRIVVARSERPSNTTGAFPCSITRVQEIPK